MSHESSWKKQVTMSFVTYNTIGKLLSMLCSLSASDQHYNMTVWRISDTKWTKYRL